MSLANAGLLAAQFEAHTDWRVVRRLNLAHVGEALFGEVDVPITAPDLTSLTWVPG